MPLSKRAKAIIEQLIESGDSQALAVGECLQTIAENGYEQSSNQFLIGCAQEIIAASQRFIDALRPRRLDPAAKIAAQNKGMLAGAARKIDRLLKQHDRDSISTEDLRDSLAGLRDTILSHVGNQNARQS